LILLHKNNVIRDNGIFSTVEANDRFSPDISFLLSATNRLNLTFTGKNREKREDTAYLAG
jgi:hypothetical protein